jgi:hypothetical protein
LLRAVLEVLASQPSQPFSTTRLLQLLEAKGIHTQSCQQAIFNLLEGQLPTGLLPTKASAVLFTPESLRSSDYRELTAAPLFSRQANQMYMLNPQQRDRLWNHLQAILANTHQTLENPLGFSLGQDAGRRTPEP